MRGGLAVVVLALVVPSGALSSNGDLIHVSGSAVVAGDHVEVGALGDAAGTVANGHIEAETLLNGIEPLHEDAAVVCVRAEGNRAVVVGRLREPVTTDQVPGAIFTGAALLVEDNGPPVHGQPVDRAADFILRERTLERFCTTPFPFEIFAFVAAPIDSGNFTVDD